jgi:hypothetical protein
MAEIPRRMEGYPYAQYPLGIPVGYSARPQDPNENRQNAWSMNAVGEDPDVGFYPAQQDLYNSQTIPDFNVNYLPAYQNANSFVFPTVDKMQDRLQLQSQATPLYRPWDAPVNPYAPPPTTYQGVTTEDTYLRTNGLPVPLPPVAPPAPVAPVVSATNGKDCKNCKVVEGFSFLEADPATRVQPSSAMNAQQQLGAYYSQPAPQELQDQFGSKGVYQSLGADYTAHSRVSPSIGGHGQNMQIPMVTDQLMSQSPVYGYTADYFNSPNNKLFLSTVQPQLYSYAVDQQPINSSIGISYAPQNPPRVLDQVTANALGMPLFSRIDPQLIRTDGPPGLQARQPIRTDWSAEYSNYQPPAGTINYEDIYDPRFTSYGDPYRSYTDINLGQVQYYYSDIDAYKMPNFISRSNVDFVDFRTPQGQIWPEYNRTAGLDDVRSHVENQTTSDELFHREDMMSLQMSKANRNSWQQRFAPLSKNPYRT